MARTTCLVINLVNLCFIVTRLQTLLAKFKVLAFHAVVFAWSPTSRLAALGVTNLVFYQTLRSILVEALT